MITIVDAKVGSVFFVMRSEDDERGGYKDGYDGPPGDKIYGTELLGYFYNCNGPVLTFVPMKEEHRIPENHCNAVGDFSMDEDEDGNEHWSKLGRARTKRELLESFIHKFCTVDGHAVELPRCCGKKRTTKYCPDCGSKL